MSVRGNLDFVGQRKPYVHEPELIRHTLPLTGVAFIAGQSGALKTFLGLELSVCIMTGHAFAGRVIEQTGGVLYIACEGASTIAGRLEARRTTMPNPNIELPFWTLVGFGKILTPDDFQALAQTLTDTSSAMKARFGVPLRAVIIDTVAAAGMIAPDSENDPGAWQQVFDSLKPISDALGAVMVLIHHMGKSVDAGLRGSSNARAGADVVLAMTCSRNEITGDAKNYNLALTKSRTGAEGSIAAVTSEKVEIGHRPDGSTVTSLILKFDTAIILKSFSRGRKQSKGRTALKLALDAALLKCGRDNQVQGDANGTHVKTVTYEQITAMFERFYGNPGQTDDKKRRNALRVALMRAIDASSDISTGRWGQTDFVWLPHGWKVGK